MKPAWDKLSDAFKSSNTVTVADVDCTAAGESICTKVGVSGYPTIKYWLADDPKPKDYNGGRDLDALKAFTEKTFKAGCNVSTEENCTDVQKEDIKKYKDLGLEDLKKEVTSLNKEADDLKDERFKFIDESKAKIKKLKQDEAVLSARSNIASKFVEKLEPKEKKEEL